jgi:hypothetical protein
MTRHGPRHAEQVRADKPDAPKQADGASPEPAEAPQEAAPAGRSSLAWRVATFVWVGAFVALLLFEVLVRALFRGR